MASLSFVSSSLRTPSIALRSNSSSSSPRTSISFSIKAQSIALSQDELKKLAAEKAVEAIKPGMVLGLGTGSTAAFAVDQIGKLLSSGKLYDIVGIPTSKRTEEQARSLGIPLVALDTHPRIDLAIDGADEVDPNLDLVKGRGGALLREKMVEAVADKFIVVADDTKLVKGLGGSGLAMPVEVVQFCWKFNLIRLRDLFKEFGCDAKLRIDGDGEPYDASRVASFITLLTLPISVLREFLKLIAWKKGLSQSQQTGEIAPPAQRPRIELCLENHSGSDDNSAAKSNIHYDRVQNTVDFALTVVLDPLHIPQINAAGGAAWLPYCVSVKLRYTFGDSSSVTFLGMEGSHGGRACWQRVDDWEKCKQRASRTVEANGSVVAGDLSQGKLKSVADMVQRTLHLCLQGLREGSNNAI